MYKRKTQRFAGIVLVLFIMTSSLYAVESAGFQFLGTQVGARPAALAGAVVAHFGDIHSMYFNPAGLGTIEGRITSATYLKHVVDFHSGFLGYAQSLEEKGVLAAGINYIDYGQFDHTDETGNKLGTTFNANTMVFTGSYAYHLMDSLYIGASAKYIRSVIDNFSSEAIAADIGLIYNVPFIDSLDIGFAVLNLGQALSAFDVEKEPLPMKVVAGFSKQLAHLPLLLNVNAYKFSDDDLVRIAIGGEFTPAKDVRIRIGYDSMGRDAHVNSDLDRIAGVSVGFGFAKNDYQLDYAFSSLGQIGSMHRMTFSYAF